MVPSIPCENVSIIRTFNIDNNKENIEILIDGNSNELTKNVGFETFINDFILPREIAKFSFLTLKKLFHWLKQKPKKS